MTFRTVFIMVLLAAVAHAGTPAGPVGRWKTYDDRTGALHGLVEITEEQGVLKGRILRSYDPLKPNPTCDLCEGERKGQPTIGMVFLWGLTRQGEEFKGGFILDPDNGKIYKAKLRLDEGGRKLLVRGFIGISLLGRTQTWIRED
jgi:uncharacterized protein (DUF2147 family)